MQCRNSAIAMLPGAKDMSFEEVLTRKCDSVNTPSALLYLAVPFFFFAIICL